jgi:hypothetical protein
MKLLMQAFVHETPLQLGSTLLYVLRKLNSRILGPLSTYVRALISLRLSIFPIFLFAAQTKEFFLDWLEKLEQRRR